MAYMKDSLGHVAQVQLPIGIHYSKANAIVLLKLETTNLLRVLNHLNVTIVVTYLL